MHILIGFDLIKSLRMKEFKRNWSMQTRSNSEEKIVIIRFQLDEFLLHSVKKPLRACQKVTSKQVHLGRSI